MKVTVKKLADLHQPQKNVRLHTNRQINEFKRSVEMFGQIRPMVVDETGQILAGNGLYETLLAMGRTEADCYVMTGLSENEKKKLMLTDNKIYSLGVDDMQAFDEILKELGEDIDIPGFDDDLLKTLTANQDEIDEILSDYGTLSESSISNIKAHAQDPAAAPVPDQGVAPAPPDAPQRVPIYPTQESQQSAPEHPPAQYIICPNCGKRIMI